MRVLVTGGAGFLGLCLVQALLNDDHEVVVLDNFWTGSSEDIQRLSANSKLQIVDHDITLAIPDSIAPCDRIYHLACPASPVHFTKTPLKILETCFIGTKNSLEAARRWNARFLLSSTSEVYGNAQIIPQPESYFGNVNCFGPRACYDEGKRVAEALVYGYRQEHKLDVRVARIFNAYGPGMHGNDGRVISSFISAALKGEDLIINGNGDSTRCFQYVDDCIRGLMMMMERPWQGSPINIGCEEETSIQNIAELVVRMVSERAATKEVGIKYGERLQDDPIRRKPDCSLAKKVLGWQIEVDLQAGLEMTIAWHRSAPEMAN